MKLEIIYALPEEQILRVLHVEHGTTVGQAIQQTDILQCYPTIDLTKNKVGIFNKIVNLTDKVNEGDRIEIYRPLLIDPKTARRKRARA